ncbi:YraN family protein [Saccharomonospora piscinae]|uniref:YraN family protein n=1 Tax=Saccharomonospora piscinae TaxID=687388 RepID=UPI0004670E3E|nr:YraN family protein [Saccharomonospora piscinae]
MRSAGVGIGTSRAPDRPGTPAALGRRGEDLAGAYLRRQGLIVLERNWRCREGELDVLATDGRTLIVCEVKTRSGRGYGSPAEAVTRDKRNRIRGLALRWLAARRVAWCPMRFDVIAIDHPPGGPPRLRHVVGAF